MISFEEKKTIYIWAGIGCLVLWKNEMKWSLGYKFILINICGKIGVPAVAQWHWQCSWSSGIPSPVQWVKDLEWPQLWFMLQLRIRSDPWPGISICNREPKKD